MLISRLCGKPTGWVALGALQVIMVDNGGPYLSRLANIATVLFGGFLAVMFGILAGVHLSVAIFVTLIICFAFTLARVVSQPFAASSVTVLVCYVVAYGASDHSLYQGATSALYFGLGGLWAAIVTLVLWPDDPFTPARNAVANLYATLSELVTLLPEADDPSANPEGTQRFNAAIARFRLRIEAAHEAIAATPARMTSRTVRARNLSALAESADLVLARLLRIAELGNTLVNNTAEAHHDHLAAISLWLQTALAPIEPALRQRPPRSNAAPNAFSPEGQLYANLRRTLPELEATFDGHNTPQHSPADAETATHLISALRDSSLAIEIAYEAIRAIWSGAEPLRTLAAQQRASLAGTNPRAATPMLWLESLQSNLTLRSVMFRHALRLSAVVTIDVILMHLFQESFNHYTHGYWLAMTSLIVLQPYTGETVRRSGERVAGTLAGAVIAAIITALIPSSLGIVAAITVGTIFTVASYTADYAMYCFFLTPTIVLMTLPHLHDWHFAAVRMGMTCLGATIAVAAMLLLWPERESLQLPGLLAAGALADAAYLRAVIAFWSATDTLEPVTSSPRNDDGCPGSGLSDPGVQGPPQPRVRARITAESTLLAPARRACGLAANGAEEALDHALLEHALPLNPERASTERLNAAALTFTAYLRRMTQSITTFAAVGEPTVPNEALLENFAWRLHEVAQALTANTPPRTNHQSSSLLEHQPNTLSGQQLRRIERQISVLERTATDLCSSR
jgi:uncharacterized membrane protein YccC